MKTKLVSIILITGAILSTTARASVKDFMNQIPDDGLTLNQVKDLVAKLDTDWAQEIQSFQTQIDALVASKDAAKKSYDTQIEACAKNDVACIDKARGSLKFTLDAADAQIKTLTDQKQTVQNEDAYAATSKMRVGLFIGQINRILLNAQTAGKIKLETDLLITPFKDRATGVKFLDDLKSGLSQNLNPDFQGNPVSRGISVYFHTPDKQVKAAWVVEGGEVGDYKSQVAELLDTTKTTDTAVLGVPDTEIEGYLLGTSTSWDKTTPWPLLARTALDRPATDYSTSFVTLGQILFDTIP